jgi:tape measure domain-containing protein
MSDLNYTLGLDGRSFGEGVRGALAGLANLGLSIDAVKKVASGLTLGVRLAADFETTSTAINTVLKDMQLTKAVLEDLASFAATTPFEMPGIAATARQLLGAGTQVGDLKEELRVLGDLAAGAGGDMAQLALVLNQVRGAGKLMTQDFYQLTNAGVVGLRDELAKLKGIGIDEVAEAMSRGEISADDLWKVLRGMTAEGGKFFNAMVAQSTTWNGLMSTIRDNAGGLMRTLGQPVMEALKPTLQEVIDGLGRATRFASIFSETLKLAAVDGRAGEFLGVAVQYGLKKAAVSFIEFAIEGFKNLGDVAYEALYNGFGSAWNATLGKITGTTFEVGSSFAQGFMGEMLKSLEETEARFEEFMQSGRLKIEADKTQAKQALEEAGKAGGQAIAREAKKGMQETAGKDDTTPEGRRKIKGFSRARAGLSDRSSLDEFYALQQGERGSRGFAGFGRGTDRRFAATREQGYTAEEAAAAGSQLGIESPRARFALLGERARQLTAQNPTDPRAAGRGEAAATGEKLDAVVSELRRIRTE